MARATKMLHVEETHSPKKRVQTPFFCPFLPPNLLSESCGEKGLLTQKCSEQFAQSRSLPQRAHQHVENNATRISSDVNTGT